MLPVMEKRKQREYIQAICNQVVDELFECRKDKSREMPMFSVSAKTAKAHRRFSRWLESVTTKLETPEGEEGGGSMSVAEAFAAIFTNPILVQKIKEWPDVLVRVNRCNICSTLALR